jgi:hypothetical protein
MQVATALFSGPGFSGLAVALGLASATGFATSNALQHRAAGTVPASVRGAFAVLVHLARRPVWLVATCISFCALLLHAVALRVGSIAVVQPLMLVGVVLAVPARSALARTLPKRAELRAVGVTVVGLTAFILAAAPRSSDAPPNFARGGGFVVGCFAAGLWALRASRRCQRTPARQAAMLGVGAGVMFGATAGLLKIVGSKVSSGSVPWPIGMSVLIMLVGAGVLGTAMNQRAYQIAPIAYSMPLVNVVDIVVAVIFGAVVLGELPALSPVLIMLQLTGLACICVGLRFIAALPRAATGEAPIPIPAGLSR